MHYLAPILAPFFVLYYLSQLFGREDPIDRECRKFKSPLLNGDEAHLSRIEYQRREYERKTREMDEQYEANIAAAKARIAELTRKSRQRKGPLDML